MKLAACYTVFNGEELLEKSMEQISHEVDVFIICYQTISNKGNENRTLDGFLSRFDGRLNVILVHFTPNLALNTKENERNKHEIMLKTARLHGATHVLLAACDHFYDKNQFSIALRESIVGDFDVTFTRMFTYYKRPTWQISPPEEYFMPLIIKLHHQTSIISRILYPVLVDPSVKVNTCDRWHVFTLSECALHHYSMIRADIDSKFNNAAASMRWTVEQIKRFKREYETASVGSTIEYFQNRKICEVDNYFLL